MTWVISILILLLVLAVHEGGHAIAAALLEGVTIKEYVIGLPWPHWLTIKIGKFRISPILILAGVEIDEKSYQKASLRKKVLIALAGPEANFIAGIISAACILGFAKGWFFSSEIVQAGVKSITMLFTGKVPISALTSPVGVVVISHGFLQQDLLQGAAVMWLLLSFIIPIMNLLPIPALDGGQVLMAIAGEIGGNTPKVIATIQRITLDFFVILTTGTILLTLRDVANLFR
jgi:regulator of sigma E protease